MKRLIIYIWLFGFITLTWQQACIEIGGGPTRGYKIYYKADKMFQSYTPVDVGNVTTKQLELPNGPYCFKITAYNNNGESGFSRRICGEVK